MAKLHDAIASQYDKQRTDLEVLRDQLLTAKAHGPLNAGVVTALSATTVPDHVGKTSQPMLVASLPRGQTVIIRARTVTQSYEVTYQRGAFGPWLGLTTAVGLDEAEALVRALVRCARAEAL